MPLNSVVIVREVWDTRDLVGNILDGGTIKESSLTTRFEPEDLNALEMALRIKDKLGGTVTAISIGEPRDVDVLRECLYREVDEVIRITDPSLNNLDTLAAAYVLAQAIRRSGDFDLVLSGIDIADGESSLLGAHIAGFLGIDQVSYVDDLEEISDEKLICKRAVEMGYEYVEARFPVMLIVGVALLQDDPRSPRSAKAKLKLKMKKRPIPTLSAGDLDLARLPELSTARIVALDAVPERIIDSQQVDPEDLSALKKMLGEILG